MTRIGKEIGYYYSIFCHLGSVKLYTLIEPTCDPTLHSTAGDYQKFVMWSLLNLQEKEFYRRGLCSYGRI